MTWVAKSTMFFVIDTWFPFGKVKNQDLLLLFGFEKKMGRRPQLQFSIDDLNRYFLIDNFNRFFDNF